MPRNGHEIDIHLVNVDGNLADGLRGVGVEENFLAAAQLANLVHRLHNADLVVDCHDGNERRLRPDGLLQVFHADEAIGLDWQVGDIETFILQVAARVEHALMLGLAGNDVVLLAVALEEARHALNGHVVALRRTARENNLLWVGTNKISDVSAGLLDSLVGFPAVGVGARVWVAIEAGEEGHHSV